MHETRSSATEKKLIGSLTEALGKLTGDRETEARGALEKLEAVVSLAVTPNGEMASFEPAEPTLPRPEQIEVTRKPVVGDTIRAHTRTIQREHCIDELLTEERVEVFRVQVDRVVETIPDIRQEGEDMVLPVVVEELVVHRRLVLKEEVHLRRTRVTRPYREMVTLREQDAIVTRLKPDPDEAGHQDRPDAAASPDAT